jgi:hypothetical protein
MQLLLWNTIHLIQQQPTDQIEEKKEESTEQESDEKESDEKKEEGDL